MRETSGGWVNLYRTNPLYCDIFTPTHPCFAEQYLHSTTRYEVVPLQSDMESIFSFMDAKTGKSTKLLQFRPYERKNSFHAGLKQQGATFFLLIQRTK